MSFIKEIKERRIFQWVVSYAAAGWIALSVLDQLADREVVGNIVYVVGLVWYVGGLAAATIFGWYHGEKGAQDVQRIEVVLLSILGVVVLGMSGWTVAQSGSGGAASAMAPVRAAVARAKTEKLLGSNRMP